jgi:integrase
MAILKTLTQHQINQGALRCPTNMQKIELCLGDLPGAYALVTPTNQTWYYRAKLNGKNQHFRIGAVSQVSLADLRRQVTLLRGQLASGTDLKSDVVPKVVEGITLREYFRQYLERAKQTKKSWVRDMQAFKHIDVGYGDVKLADITLAMVQKQRTEQMNSGLYKAATVNHSTKLWRQLLRQAAIEGLRPPLLGIKLLPVQNIVENYLDDQSLGRLLSVLATYPNRTVSLMCLWLLSTAARSGEAMKAKWSDIDRERRLWKIGAENSKSRIAGSIFLNETALEVLDQLDTQGKYEYLFVNAKTGKRYGSFAGTWLRIKALCGLEKYRIHDLRHQHAVMLINAGRTLFEVAGALRHKDPNSTTVRYAHLTSKTMQDVSNCADLAIKRAMAEATTAV